MTAAEFREMALSFPEATESSHNGLADFRVGGKIFASLGYPNSDCAVVMLAAEDQALYIRLGQASFSPAAGAWGRQGCTVVRLPDSEAPLVRDALEDAWSRRASKRLRMDGR